MQRRQFQPLHPPITAAQTADHDVLVLADNLRIHPDLLIGNGNGIFGSGVQGTGKTGILCRILEQAAQFHVPMVVFDREGDLAPAAQLFPKGVVGTRENCPCARDVLGSGLQVVYDHTWPRHPRHIFAVNVGRCVRLSGQDNSGEIALSIGANPLFPSCIVMLNELQ